MPVPMKLKETLHKATTLIPFILMGVALMIVHHEIQVHNLRDISRTVYDMPWFVVAASIALMAVNYLILAGYDTLALRYTGHSHIPLRKVMLTSLISYAISNNTGHAWAAGGSIRYRFYTTWGVPGWDILKISLFLGLTYIVGVMTMGFAGALLLPQSVRESIENPQMIHVMMISCAVFLALYWGALLFWRKPVRIKGVSVAMPSPLAGVGQTLIACFDLILAGAVLWVFLAGQVPFGFETFIIIYILAQVAGLLSQVPGGIGVFEGAFLWLLSGTINEDQHLVVVSALVLYRIIYFFLPLLVAGAGLFAYEMHVRRHAISEGSRIVSKIFNTIMPQLFAFLLLLSGAVLLLSGATPNMPDSVQWLRDFVPLPVMEVSHLLGSLIGLMLLFLARGIYLRIDAAWHGSILLLAGGIVVSLLKGFDWHEAAVLAVMLALLLPARGYFRRPSSLFNMPLSWAWAAMVLAVVLGSTWLGFFAYRHVDYGDHLWWRFAYDADAPRFLRALLAMVVVATAYLLTRLMRVVRPHHYVLPDGQEIAEASALVRRGDDVQGFLALLGDKKFFWSSDRQAFIMFAQTAKYWIAMGNPVGNPQSYDALLWAFREEADRHGVRIVFYEAGKNLLPALIDLGLTLLKIGEEAKIKLSDFSLEGGHRENLRKARNKFSRNGYSFSILERADVMQHMPVLRAVSDKWLTRKNTQEKRFSLGFFDEDYISHTRVAVVRDQDGQITAFANLWETAGQQEISIDLMRYDPEESPAGVMDFLFVELILWAQQADITWFNLGMVPLSGLERHTLAPLWHKIGTAIYDLGEEFYNFEGLHDYKAKFDPVWFPRYLAVPAGLSAPLILMTVAKLIAGSWKGILGKQA